MQASKCLFKTHKPGLKRHTPHKRLTCRLCFKMLLSQEVWHIDASQFILESLNINLAVSVNGSPGNCFRSLHMTLWCLESLYEKFMKTPSVYDVPFVPETTALYRFVHVYSHCRGLLVKINECMLMCLLCLSRLVRLSFMSSPSVVYKRLFPKIMAFCSCQKS